MKRRVALLLPLLMPFLLSACLASTPAPTLAPPTAPPTAVPPSATPVPGPCDPERINATVKPVAEIMRAFDDTSRLASNVPRAQLAGPISALQALRRQAETLETSDCLVVLKNAQIGHMNAVIDTLLAFLRGASGEVVATGLKLAQTYHAAFDTELARLTGVTLTPGPTPIIFPTEPPGSSTPAASPTPPRPTITVIERANLRQGPGTESDLVGVMEAGQTAPAVGRTPASDWLLVEFAAAPNGTAWLLASLVTLDVPVEQLPEVTP